MIFIVIMIVLIVIAILSYFLVDGAPAAGTCGALAVICFFAGMWAPFGGYDKPIMKEEYELIPLFAESNIYIIETENGTKVYKVKETSEHDNNIKRDVIKEKDNSVEIEYANEYSKPVLRKYVQKPTTSIWNGIQCEENEYYILFASEECVMK